MGTTTQTYAYPATSNKLSSITQAGAATRSFAYGASGDRVSDAAGSSVLGEQYEGASRLGDLEKRSQARRRQVDVSRLDRP